MLRKKKSAYEVLIFRDEQWMLEHLLDDEDQAKSAADRLMLQPTTAGVRITKKILRQDGGSVGVVVSEVMKTSMPLTQVRIADGIEAPFCESLENYYELSSRLTIRRLLADYLDQKMLLVSEVLHCADEADKLLAVIPLIKSAVTTAAGSHARLTGGDAAGARNALNRRIDEMAARARAARGTYQRNFKSRQAFAPLAERFGKAGPGDSGRGAKGAAKGGKAAGKPDDARFALTHAACTELLGARDWAGKLSRLTDWLYEPVDDKAAAVLDGLVADLFASGAAVRELFGSDADPSLRLCRLYDVVRGDETSALLASLPDNLRALAHQFDAGRLPQARGAALFHIQVQLGDSRPSARDAKASSFMALLDRLVTEQGVEGGPEMAEAITSRHARTQEQGGLAGLKEAMARLLALMGEPARKINYIQALAQSPLAQRQPRLMLEALDDMAARPRLISSFVDSGSHPVQKMKVLSNTHALLSAAQLPGDIRSKLLHMVDTVFTDFLTENRILEKLDNPELSLRQRVIKLAQLCTQGLLTPGRPLDMARTRLFALVARNGFETLVVSDLADPAERKRELASLQELLAAVPQPEPRTTESRGDWVAGRGTEPKPAEPAATRLLDHGAMAGSGATRLGTPAVEVRVCPSCFAPGFTDMCPACGYRHVPSQRDGFILAPNVMLTGRYRIGRVLGLGGFGITYVGRDERLHALVAVKEYYPSMYSVRMPASSLVAPSGAEQAGPYRTGMEKFLDEARLLAQFRTTPEIVDVLDFFTENGTAYMVMEYLEGRSLQEVLNERGGRLPFGEALSVILPVMRGLARVHEKNVLHRDISPDNIYITNDKRSKLLDFGAARMALSQGEQNLTVILKRGYAPLEQYNAGGRQGPWTDVYALCATLYRTLAAQMPADALARIEQDDLIPPSRLGVAIPPAVEKVLLKGLSLRGAERHQDMIELLGDFEAALSGRK
ncbi:serine/threonine-protein kinase [Skermanella pratensis]|uniref:serine/threonine-protein kinase n=1 Tax=Skermanella pratensis TaxID=2233999 RepID=UPI0013013CC7|nr:serine/threonine-protein kinase [Skermanella pratensis]